MTNLVEHLRNTGNLWAYIKLLAWRHRRIFAYVLLAVFTAYAVFASTQYSDKLARTAEQQRVERANAILLTTAQSSFASCVNNNNTLVEPLRRIIFDGQTQSKITIGNLVKDGTFSKKQGEDFLRNSQRNAKINLGRIQYRDCSGAADRFINQIADPIERATLRGQYAEKELYQRRLRDERNAP